MPTPRNQSKGHAHAGFTMVELLVVITIIAILAGLLMPAVIGAMRRARETKTLNLIHQCETAVLAYYNDYGDYPPSTWAELGLDVVPPTETTNPDTFNEGIEVFTFCLASRNGGPYLDFSNEMLGNTDGPDTDMPADGLSNGGGDVDWDLDGDPSAIPDVLQHTNYYFGSTQIFEIVDFWGNPLVYVHNRDYMAHDGWRDDLAVPAWEDPNNPPAPAPEYVKYVDSEGDTKPCYTRSTSGFVTQNYPNLDSFQLYSWGPDLAPGCAESLSLPLTPNPSEPGIWPGWDKNSRNLTNWQESGPGGTRTAAT